MAIYIYIEKNSNTGVKVQREKRPGSGAIKVRQSHF